MGIFLVLAGCVGIACGIFAKNFYAADIATGAAYRQKSSTWSGRLVFIAAGLFLLAIGLKLLIWPE